jgi:hypothetical protein
MPELYLELEQKLGPLADPLPPLGPVGCNASFGLAGAADRNSDLRPTDPSDPRRGRDASR